MKDKMRSRLAVRLVVVALLGAGLLVVTGAALAGGGNSAAAKVCQHGGWASGGLQNGTGASVSFASQDECVSYGAQNGGVFNPSLTADPSTVVEDQLSTITAAGFHPSSTGVLTITVIGGSGGSVGLPAVTDASGGFTTGDVFTLGACGNGVTGAQLTYVDGSGVHASTTLTLDCS
jgi:hypothetical protein